MITRVTALQACLTSKMLPCVAE